MKNQCFFDFFLFSERSIFFTKTSIGVHPNVFRAHKCCQDGFHIIRSRLCGTGKNKTTSDSYAQQHKTKKSNGITTSIRMYHESVDDSV